MKLFEPFKLFTLFKIDVYSSFFSLLLLALISLSGGFNTALFFFLLYLSILIHEFGHALAANRINVKCNRITLDILGGQADIKLKDDIYNYNLGKDTLITLGGPLATLSLVIIGGLLYSLFNISVFKDVFVVNLILLIFNMFPIYPMDGGRLFRGFLCLFTNTYKAFKITGIVSIALSILLFGVALYFKSLLLAFLMVILGFQAATFFGKIACKS